MIEQIEHLWGKNRLLLGPMVRASSLPLRLASMDYGADVVYSEEIPSYRANPTTCMRVVNDVLGTVDFIEKKERGIDSLILFRTHQTREVDKRCCVLQLGTTDSVAALKAAKLFERDVAAIDINMGCSKHYSISRGMGAAHMSKPVVAEDIVKTLRRNLNIPVSVKTRLQGTNCSSSSCAHSNNNHIAGLSGVDTNATLEWVKRLESAGASAVTVHMRTPIEKTRDAAHMDLFAMLYHSMKLSNTPLVYNGDIFSKADSLRLNKSVCSADASADNNYAVEMKVPIMICRPALWNPSIFAQFKTSDTLSDSVSTEQVLTNLLKHSADTANCHLNTRYLLQQILAGAKMLSSNTRTEVVQCYNLLGLSTTLNCYDYVSQEKIRQHTLWSAQAIQSDQDTEQYWNSASWPGIVSHTSHEYNDSYFDDNYYVAFNQPSTSVKNSSVSVGKRPFSYAGFEEADTTVVRTKKKAV